jgi:hypothetical protein
MTKIALLGAGGKMGVRLATNLRKTRFEIAPVEVAEAGRARLKDATGLECMEEGQALSRADVVLLAVPDRMIGEIAHNVVPKLDPGTAVIVLDAAAPHAGEMPERADVTYFVTHPCHPPIFNDETDMAAKKDYFGGVKAKQHMVSALMQGPEEDFTKGEAIAKIIWAPVMRSHRVTVEQMALLEPGLSETVCASLLVVMKEAVDEVVARGVDQQAALDFLLGHMNVLGAVIFGETKGVFSDACNKAIEFGKPVLMRDDWKRVFEPEEIAASIQRIT